MKRLALLLLLLALLALYAVMTPTPTRRATPDDFYNYCLSPDGRQGWGVTHNNGVVISSNRPGVEPGMRWAIDTSAGCYNMRWRDIGS